MTKNKNQSIKRNVLSTPHLSPSPVRKPPAGKVRVGIKYKQRL